MVIITLEKYLEMEEQIKELESEKNMLEIRIRKLEKQLA